MPSRGGLNTPCVTYLDGGDLAVKTVCRLVSGRLLKGSSSQIAQPIKPEYIGQSSNTLVPQGEAALVVARKGPPLMLETGDQAATHGEV